MPAVLSSASELAKRFAVEAGFDHAGVAAVPDPDTPELAFFAEWIERGHAGEMEYLKKRDDEGRLKRTALRNAVPWARSVIVCAKNYNAPQPYSTEFNDPEHGWISRYAWSARDYHESVLERLRHVEARFREAVGESQDLRTWSYVDTGPLVERVYAKYAGVGWIGKNTCIINQQLGSWLFLGVIVTSVELAPDVPAADRCGTCTRCIDACPTDALVAPYELDARKCIAYLTIEKRGTIDEALREGIGRHVFGCDICQDVCPWNRKSPGADAEALATRAELVNPALEWLAAMDEEEFRRTFRASPVKRTKRSGMRRNVAIAMGNSGNRGFIPALEKMASDEDAAVAEHARWALDKLRHSQ
jgi:epoxyqueuosine reductase